MQIIILLFSLLGYAYGLSLQQAISLTLQSNPHIQEQQYLLKERFALQEANKSPFYPTLNLNYNKSNNQAPNTPYLSIQAQYNLFNGFSDFFLLESAKSLYEAQKFVLEASKEDTILLVKNAYINILRQKQNLIIAKESKELLEEQRRESAEFFRVGFIPKNDLLTIEVELSNASQNLLAAKSNLAYAIKILEQYTKTTIKPEELIELKLPTPILNQKALTSLMYQKRSELRYYDEILQSKRYEIESIKGQFYPQIQATGQYNPYRPQDKIQSHSVGIKINLNLFNGLATKNQLQASQYQKLAIQSQQNQLKEELDLQLFQALQSYHLALNAHQISKQALLQAKENYRISANRYKERIETTSNFLNAQLLLTRAKSNVILNRYAIIEAIANIERITQTHQDYK